MPGAAVGDRAVLRLLAVEDAQRIARQPVEALLGQIGLVRFEMGDQGRAPGVARLGVAERVELQRTASEMPSSRSSWSAKTSSSTSAAGESVPIISASSWWNWRKRPFCGRS